MIGLMSRWLFVAAALAACAGLAGRVGPWKALAIWIPVAGLACGAAALAVRRQSSGRITWLNYVMGYVAQWGYRLGQGNLGAIVVISWCVWILLGAAVILAISAMEGRAAIPGPSAAPGERRGAFLMTLLALSWIIDGALLAWLIGSCVQRGGSGKGSRSLRVVMAMLLVMILGSVALATFNPSLLAARAALFLSGGPLLLAGLVYGLFVLVILTVGRKTRWN